MEMNPRALDVLGDPTRRSIVDRLRGGPSPVGRLAEGMPVSRPAVSQHLTVLRTAGLVSEHREGTRRIYRLEPAGIEELGRWVEALAADARIGAAAPELVMSHRAGHGGATAGAAAPRDDRSAAPREGGGKKKRGKKRPGKKQARASHP
jgi:DNA-binding transcriptional ArsR family regulator